MSNENLFQNKRKLQSLQDKFADKQAHEEDVTGWTGAGVFLMHTIIAVSCLSAIVFLDQSLQTWQIILYCVIVGGILSILEILKSTYMERYLISDIKLNDTATPKNIIPKLEKKWAKNRNIMLVIWLSSLVVACYSGVKVAQAYSPKALTYQMDKTIVNANQTAQAAYAQAVREQASPKRQSELAARAERTLDAYNREKNRVDNLNIQSSAGASDDLYLYGILAILIAIALEFGLFYLRSIHEKEQYEIAKSLSAEMKSTANFQTAKV